MDEVFLVGISSRVGVDLVSINSVGGAFLASISSRVGVGGAFLVAEGSGWSIFNQH